MFSAGANIIWCWLAWLCLFFWCKPLHYYDSAIGTGANGFQLWDNEAVSSGMGGLFTWSGGNIPQDEQKSLNTILATPSYSHWVNGGTGVTSGYALTMETGICSTATIPSLYLSSDMNRADDWAYSSKFVRVIWKNKCLYLHFILAASNCEI